ncbi:MAG TPA: bifunctional 4-hydroxy-2-oxoglutarate aldolase/2-dehydro-3-deoxy-phosphogluconate aldolase [Candidatus Limnocylindrales bacterium]|nr:bifunctional 4-hydroxy-2-oxoglutarate aldolase/2-dehydro-3-deoxy-phosphogluconate aldolase [Candidatus Limnocylindrales bacterium]
MSTAEKLRRGAVADEIRRRRLVVILRRVEPQSRLLELVDELGEAGAAIFEVTFDAPSAADDVAALKEHLAGRDALVGAGTLLTAQHLAAAIEAGADFGVAPVHNFALTRAAVETGLPFMPGAFTPTEMLAAWSAGATFVKLFPASAAGPQAVRELRGPLPEIEIIPTGGVDRSNAVAFLEAGAVAVGIGSALVRAAAGERRELVARLARQ